MAMKPQPTYDQQEGLLLEQSEAFLGLLQRRGILEDGQIDDETRRRAIMDRKRKTYHNTLLMLQNYRNISWALECFPAQIGIQTDADERACALAGV